MEKIKKLIPEPIKKFLIKVHYIPEKIFLKVYYLASEGKLYVPDKLFQKWDYKIHCGRKLSFKNPQTFTEKLQWMKYYYHNPEYTKLVDKFEVRKYVAEKIGEEYLVPIFGVYNSWDEINFDELPDKFVIKCTHDSGSVVICTDKSKFDFDAAKAKINSGLVHNHFYKSREWIYKIIKPRIIVEKFLEEEKINSDENVLTDYKWFCFGGAPEFMYISKDISQNPHTDFFDMDYNILPIKSKDPNSAIDSLPSKPIQFNSMKQLSIALSSGIPFVRCDFYVVNGKIYFGELTFFHCGGRRPFAPYEYEKKFGDMITLPPKMR